MFALLPFEAERSIVKWDKKKGAKKQERLQKIAKEAREQAHRTYIPEVYEPISFSQLVQQASQFDAVFLADEEDARAEQRTSFADKLQLIKEQKAQSMLVIFGPEGAFRAKKLRHYCRQVHKRCR